MLNFDWLNNVSQGMAKAVILGLFFLITLLVWLIPHDYVVESVKDPKLWHNLKWWATGVMILIALLYLYF